MERKSERKALIIVIGVVFSMLGYLWIYGIESFLAKESFSDKSLIERLMNDDPNASLYLCFSLIVHFGVILNLYIKTQNKIFKSINSLLISTIGCYVLMYLIYFQLSRVLLYIAFLSPIFAYIFYLLLMSKIYALKSVASEIIIGVILLIVAVFLMNTFEKFRLLDFIFALTLTIVFPLNHEE